MTIDRNNQQVVGMRFTGLNIPANASIVNAYIQFQTDEASSDPTSLILTGEAIDNAPTFTTLTSNVSSRVRTLASVSWSPAPWLIVGEAGLNQRTPDLSAVTQDLDSDR